ncbi:hypothetical protein MA16_Dca022390 [Dendrobium catenatum]|uniref:Uncharacterized protein n=1 Tax=Dendrobium catenatum TaxID=906689 RepID=A0A2I0VTB0_9ASPA|nr:hypothetical protein MA16_Dca022390 [Dendrobium catenatum]
MSTDTIFYKDDVHHYHKVDAHQFCYLQCLCMTSLIKLMDDKANEMTSPMQLFDVEKSRHLSERSLG